MLPRTAALAADLGQMVPPDVAPGASSINYPGGTHVNKDRSTSMKSRMRTAGILFACFCLLSSPALAQEEAAQDGKKRMTKPSRFLEEIPSELISQRVRAARDMVEDALGENDPKPKMPASRRRGTRR